MGCRWGKERSELTEYFLGSILTPAMAPPKGTSGKDRVRQAGVFCQLLSALGEEVTTAVVNLVNAGKWPVLPHTAHDSLQCHTGSVEDSYS